MRISLVLCLICVASGIVRAQSQPVLQSSNAFIAAGVRQGSLSLDYFYNWQPGASRKFQIGLGARITSYIGSNQYHATAPADLAVDVLKSDSLLLSTAQVHALNLAVQLGYRLSEKVSLGFNIDAVGVSFGANKNGRYLNGNQGQLVQARPTPLNILLVGNHDRGTLNSQFFIRYHITKSWAATVAYQFLFVEYTTAVAVQQQPEPNDRFRNKASMFGVGITKLF